VSATTWYVARSSAIVAYLLVSSSVVLGALMAGRVKFAWPRFAVEEVHRFLALLAGVFIVVHGSALLLDTVVPISLAQELVPFSSPYRPFAVALGVLAAELMAAVGITNLFRSRLPHTLWRRAHYLTLAVWGLATVHGLLAGTDRLDPWFAGIAAATAASVAMVLFTRFSAHRPSRARVAA
jgi:methionine sulfoxide reductase heme-binding subunit